MEKNAKPNKKPKFYDNSFPQVFSNKKILLSLLEDFIGEDWIRDLDLENAEIKKSDYKGIWAGKREADLVIRIPYTWDKELAVCLLIEFQRSPKTNMLSRLLEYILRESKNLLEKVSSGKLPVIVPIVIYNGTQNWTEKENFLAMFRDATVDLQRYVPNFTYLLMDVH